MNQVALVTGGGRGLGRAFALALARHGLRVAVASRSAGTAAPYGPTWETDSAQWWSNPEVNLKGPMSRFFGELSASSFIGTILRHGDKPALNVLAEIQIRHRRWHLLQLFRRGRAYAFLILYASRPRQKSK